MTKPTVGTQVLYRLSAGDVAEIDRTIPQRGDRGQYLRNPVSEGQVLPARVTATFGAATTANLAVQLDGCGTYWATSRTEDPTKPCHWFLPPRGVPRLGDLVVYRGKQGVLAPRSAVVTATVASLDPGNVEAGAVPALTDEQHLHLWVFTPGVSGGFAEFDVPCGGEGPVGEIPPGSWCWPPRD